MLCEKRNTNTKWKRYFKTLPDSLENFPIFYDLEDLSLLTGSKFQKLIKEKQIDIKQDYDLMCNEIPEFGMFSLTEFSEMRMLVCSRICGVKIGKNRTEIFVPYGDMFNHRRPS